jgi:ACS family tartrate transporter-like MFS transporter
VWRRIQSNSVTTLDGQEPQLAPTIGDISPVVLRKVARHFLPLIGLCYVILYIDRLNIGVAALTMNRDLGISASAFGFAAGVYFWSYTLFEIPSNYLLSRIGARIWIPRIMITWGLLTIGMSLVNGETSLAVMRLLVGLAEAGFSPGMLYFVSRWFPATTRGAAMSWVVTFICVSGLGTPVSTYILQMNGVAGLAGWRWLFILTGIPAVILGVVCSRILREDPVQAGFLTTAERSWLLDALKTGTGEAAGTRELPFRRGMAHPRVLVLIAVFLCVTFSLNGYQLWMPQIFAKLGLSTVAIGWVGALPSLLAIGPMLWWTRHSDRTMERSWHFTAAAAVAAAGFLLAAVFLGRPVVAIAGFCLAGIGLYSALAIFVTIPASFLAGAALAAGFGVINGLGNIGGYLGPQVTGIIKDATGSFTGAVALFGGAMGLAALILVTLSFTTRAQATDGRAVDTAEGRSA